MAAPRTRTTLGVCLGIGLLLLGAQKGDVNLDGRVDAGDVYRLQQALKGALSLTGPEELAADVAPLLLPSSAGDGTVDTGDLSVLLDALSEPNLDGDGVSAWYEAELGLSPLLGDTDGDGIPDGEDDEDHDGLSNRRELTENLDPHDSDSDDDGILDGLEFATPPEPGVATGVVQSSEFLVSGTDPIQRGADLEEIDGLRQAVVRGRAITPAGAAIVDVEVSVVGHPELGSTRTRVDGEFDLVANGGGIVTFQYRKAGHLPVLRQVDAPWQEYAHLPEVVLLPLDTNETTINLYAEDPQEIPLIQVARGSVMTDSFGTRQATLFFRRGTAAEMRFPAPTSPQPITEPFTVRATEYTVGARGAEAMPAELPPSSAYTYAVEYTVDQALAAGATSVAFTGQPVLAYLENFLGFPVGTPIPNGYLDREKAAWVPQDNGKVVKVVAVVGDYAELDTDGNGSADCSTTACAGLGFASPPSTVEQEELKRVAVLYAVGATLWRVPLTHFSDFNLAQADPPNAPAPKPVPPTTNTPTPETCKQGSIIRCESQTLGEAVALTGSEQQLHYASSRVPANASGFHVAIPVTGPEVPAGLVRAEIKVRIAGRDLGPFVYSSPTANQTHPFTWDGLDAHGRLLQGRQPMEVETTYVYAPSSYVMTADFGRTAAGASAFGPTRREFRVRQSWTGYLGAWDARAIGIGGWTLTSHHTYDPATRTLYRGDGAIQQADQWTDIVTTVAGGGSGWTEGGLATTFNFQCGVSAAPRAAMAPDGKLYVVRDCGAAAIYLVDPGGSMYLFAGGGTSVAEGAQALAARISNLSDLIVAPDGSVYFASTGSGHDWVRRIGPDGRVFTVAGTGVEGFDGDEGPAIQAKLSNPNALALAPDGTLYILDSGNGRVRRVDPAGEISTYAGIGPSNFGADGIPATQSGLGTVTGMDLGRDGSLYISAYQGTVGKVRRITPAGTIERIAGGGSGIAQDGDDAKSRNLEKPIDVVALRDGSIWIAENEAAIVSRVTPDGRIRRIAGTRVQGSSQNPDGSPATGTKLTNPQRIARAQDGTLLISDLTFRVLQVGPPFPRFTVGDLIVPGEDGREIYQFDAAGRHLRTLDALTMDPITEFAYEDGLLTAVIDKTATDPAHDRVTVERAANGEPTAIVAPFGQRTELDLDAYGWLSAIRNPAAEQHSFLYTPSGLMTQYTTPRGGTPYTFTYWPDGKLKEDFDPAGGSKTLTRSALPDGYSVSIVTELGTAEHVDVEVDEATKAQTRRARTVLGGGLELVRESVEQKNGVTTTTHPDGTVEVTETAGDPRLGLATPYVKRSETTTPAGREAKSETTRTVQWNKETAVVSQHEDVTTVHGQDAAGQPQDRVHRRKYQVTTVGQTTTRKVTTTTPAGRTVVDELDVKGRLISRQVGNLEKVGLEYDTAGRIHAVRQGQGAAERATVFDFHPTTGLPTQITDAGGRILTFDTYDAAARVTQQTLPGNRVVGFGWDASDNLTRLTPPGRPDHVFRYTPLDLENEYEPPVAIVGQPRITETTWDADRRLDLVERPDGLTIDPGYDAAGLLDTITIPQGVLDFDYIPPATPPATGPSGAGRLAQVSAPGGETLAFAWDGSLLTSATWFGPVTGSVGFDYEQKGLRPKSETVVGASGTPVSVSYGYDLDSLLTQAGALSLTRHPSHGLVMATTLGSITTALDYSTFGERTFDEAKHGTTLLYRTDYTQRDKLGRIESKQEQIRDRAGNLSTKTVAYTYDAAGRLDTVSENAVLVRDFSYDANGNRLSEFPGQPPIASYDDQDRMTSHGAASFTYTAAGELLAKTEGGQTTTYGYDPLGALREVQLPGGTTIAYVIDGLGRRVGKKRNGVPETSWLYSDALRIVVELDGSNNLISRFVYAEGVNVPEYVVRASGTYRIVTDHLGSTRLVVNASTGEIVQRTDYDAWGQVTFEELAPDFAPIPFGFAGGLYDRDTGLVRLGARDYDPRSGRWTSKDPIRFEGSDTNLFVYASGDPVNRVDFYGMSDEPSKEVEKNFSNSAKQNRSMNPFAQSIGKELARGAREVCIGEAGGDHDKQKRCRELYWCACGGLPPSMCPSGGRSDDPTDGGI